MDLCKIDLFDPSYPKYDIFFINKLQGPSQTGFSLSVRISRPVQILNFKTLSGWIREVDNPNSSLAKPVPISLHIYKL